MSRSRTELAVVTWGAATFGAVLGSYSAFRPVRESIMVGGDPDRIPWLFLATLAVTLAVSPVWGRLVARAPRHLVTTTFHGFAACTFAFAAANHAGLAPVVVGRVFYVWASLFGLFVVSVFWSLLADLLGPSIAQRLYGPIAAGGTAGAIVGPALTRALVDSVGLSGVLVMSGVMLELAVLGVARLRDVARDLETDGGDRPVAGGAFDGLTHVAKSPYLRSIVGYVLCTSCAATFVYLAQANIVHDAHLTDVDRTKLYASIDLWVNVATLAIQLVIAAPLIGRFGPGLVLCALPVLQAIGISVLVAAPTVAAVIAVQVVGRSATHGLTRPARELLFTVVSRDDKYRAKNVIDTVGYRLGDTASSWLGHGLTAVASGALVGAAMILVVGWIALATLLGNGFRARSS